MRRAEPNACGGDSASPVLPQARHLGWNVAGLALPLLAAFLSIPLLIQNLGMQRFGAFSLLVAAYAYVSVLDLGLASALTFRVSEMLAHGERRGRILHLLYTAAAVVIALGATFAFAGWHAAPFATLLLEDATGPLAQETVRGLRILALSLPVVFAGTLLSSLLSGHSRFAQVNAVRIGAGVLSTLGPALASFWNSDLALACGILTAVRLGAAAVHILQCRELLRHEQDAWPPSRAAFDTLLAFGAWLTVSNLVGPLMVYMDRFYLAAARPMAEVAHYAAPYELATRIGLIPAGVLPVLFPILVARWVHRRAGGSGLPIRLAAAMALGCALPAALLAVFGPEIMRTWTGGKVPASSAAVLQILAGAVFVNCVAQVFLLQLQSMGRTDLVARLHIGELAFYALLLWALTRQYGIIGVAVAWASRVTLDALLLCAVTASNLEERERRQAWRIMWATVAFGGMLSALAWVPWLPLRVFGPVVILLAALAAWQPLAAFVFRERPADEAAP